MVQKKSMLERGQEVFRNGLAIIVIIVSFVSVLLIAINFKEADGPGEKIFDSILPLLATWIGTILAFYFGRENFEAASNRYEQIIDKLSPELLDDVLVSQIMISRKTMVSYSLNKANAASIKQLLKFLDDVGKSRLPIIDGDNIKYIVHKSTFLESLNTYEGDGEYQFIDFLKNEKYLKLIKGFIKVEENTNLEKVRTILKDKPNIKDVFILNQNGSLIGWLTDTLIMRFMKS